MFELKEMSRFNKVEIGENGEIENEIIKKIEVIKQRNLVIGKGMTAKVFVSETNPQVCYKIIMDRKQFPLNNVMLEGELMEDAQSAKGAKVPKPYYSVKVESGLEVLVMERINGSSIKDFIENKMKLPERFDFDLFFRKLKEFFENLHDRGIYHRDAHSGNIMVENETGGPCVIDFGCSKKHHSDSENPYREIDLATRKTIVLTSDEEKIRNVRLALRKYIAENLADKS